MPHPDEPVRSQHPAHADAPATRRHVSAAESRRASRAWWDGEAVAYLAEHGDFLGRAGFVWGPEGLTEEEAGLLGDVSGRRVLEVGSGAAQCARWLAARGADAVALDLSGEMLRQGRVLAPDAAPDPAAPAGSVTLVQGDAVALPFADGSFDLACSAYGAVPFVGDSARAMSEVARVLRPGGRWVFSVTHPVRWCFADDPGPPGLVAQMSYFDRRPYVEEDDDGAVTYVEHHRTLGDRVREIVAAGLAVVDLVEPEWPEHNVRTWGQWSPMRGGILPGTAIFVCLRS